VACPKPSRIVDEEAVRRVRKRDGVCLYGLIAKDGCSGGTDVHHIVSRGAGGGDTMDNMILLCRRHHNLAHQGKITKQQLRDAVRHFYGRVSDAQK
jgi:5-methylcytosine-specific restriction endonuclease McrA